MKFRMILSVLLLPCITAAQQPTEKPKNEISKVPVQIPLDWWANAETAWPNTQVSAQSNVRVNLNLRNAPLKEAIKQLTEQTKQEFVLENDAPADARVTVVAKNIRLTTALDMVTDATGLNWNLQTALKPETRAARVAFHIGKKAAQFSFRKYNLMPLNDTFFQKENKSYRWNVPDIGQEHGHQTELIQRKPLDLNITYSTNNASGNTLFGTRDVTEVRSTFTCPHCKQQVTVLHQHQAPKCETCGRVFHDDWQFCPFDGAKRPADAGGDWQFCPICGKSVKVESKAGGKPGN